MTFHVNNLFDTDPPILRDGAARQNGFPSGQTQTLGRVVQVGFSKKF
jgi:outer membrane receptor protein involved in Fe transport